MILTKWMFPAVDYRPCSLKWVKLSFSIFIQEEHTSSAASKNVSKHKPWEFHADCGTAQTTVARSKGQAELGVSAFPTCALLENKLCVSGDKWKLCVRDLCGYQQVCTKTLRHVWSKENVYIAATVLSQTLDLKRKHTSLKKAFENTIVGDVLFVMSSHILCWFNWCIKRIIRL